MLFRVLFLVIFNTKLDGKSESDIFQTIWYGFRLSLKTAGGLTLIGLILGTIFGKRLRLYYGYLATIILSFAFMGRIPYYEIYSSAYNLMIYNGAADDAFAMYKTAVEQYQLWPRIVGAIILSFLLCFCLKLILSKSLKNRVLTLKRRSRIFTSAGVRPNQNKSMVIFFVSVFLAYVSYFGGGYNSRTELNWQNSSVTRSTFLNEAILDDVQAVIRARAILASLRSSSKVGNILGKDINHTAKGALLEKQPKNVVFILGENYAIWPFLNRYKSLHLVDYGEKYLTSKESAHINNFIPNGNGTMSSLKGLITGLSEVGIAYNYIPYSFKTKYETGLAWTMKKLGYKTVFWYGGSKNWQDVKKFALAQGFDEFYSEQDFNNKAKGLWGISDQDLFKKISESLNKEPLKQKVFTFVLTTSNHAPYNLDVDKAGFNRKKVRENLPKSISNDETTLNQLGHIWYSDKCLGEFVDRTKNKYPDSLFVITGDHGERFSFKTEENLQAKSGVAFIVYGKGVKPSWFSSIQAGVHMQAIPTLVEILAPKGYQYQSLLPSLTAKSKDFVFNHKLWAKGNRLGELVYLNKSQLSQKEKNELLTEIKKIRGYSSWRASDQKE
jgi:phosphoglycerol transferase MdoB-like AlkP superfamily enzyme